MFTISPIYRPNGKNIKKRLQNSKHTRCIGNFGNTATGIKLIGVVKKPNSYTEKYRSNMRPFQVALQHWYSKIQVLGVWLTSLKKQTYSLIISILQSSMMSRFMRYVTCIILSCLKKLALCCTSSGICQCSYLNCCILRIVTTIILNSVSVYCLRQLSHNRLSIFMSFSLFNWSNEWTYQQ